MCHFPAKLARVIMLILQLTAHMNDVPPSSNCWALRQINEKHPPVIMLITTIWKACGISHIYYILDFYYHRQKRYRQLYITSNTTPCELINKNTPTKNTSQCREILFWYIYIEWVCIVSLNYKITKFTFDLPLSFLNAFFKNFNIAFTTD